MDYRCKCKFQNYKTARRYIGENLDNLEGGHAFLTKISIVRSRKTLTIPNVREDLVQKLFPFYALGKEK